MDGTLAELDDTLRTGQADVVVGFYTRQKGVFLKHKDGGGYKNALLQPMRAAFAIQKDSKEIREALDGVLKEMWADGSLNKINESTLTRWRSSRPHPHNYSTTKSRAGQLR